MLKDINDEAVPSSKKGKPKVLMVPISMAGGSLKHLSSHLPEISDCEWIISPVSGVDFAIEITDNSMSPEYPLGSKILIKKLSDNYIIEWGKVYVIDTLNGIIIKELRPPTSKKAGYVSCVSINSDQSKYAPFEINLSDSLGVYRVIMVLSLK